MLTTIWKGYLSFNDYKFHRFLCIQWSRLIKFRQWSEFWNGGKRGASWLVSGPISGECRVDARGLCVRVKEGRGWLPLPPAAPPSLRHGFPPSLRPPYSYVFHRTFVSSPAGFQCCLNHVNIFFLPSPSLILFSCTIPFACLSLLHHIPHHPVPSTRPALPTPRRMSLHNSLISCPHKGFSAIDLFILTIFFSLSFLSFVFLSFYFSVSR